jgi:CopG family nickel-responsive transcriptional regulator
LLRGLKSEVEHFASHVIGERGVRYGQLVFVPADAAQGEKLLPHGHHHESGHAHRSN